MSTEQPNLSPVLPPPIEAFVEATNSLDLDRLLSNFADNALVNDQLHDYWGITAIREWAKRDIIGECLRMDVTAVAGYNGNIVVTANVDGNFDKRGLPDPLVLAFYFTIRRDKIIQLIILRNFGGI